MFKGESLEKLRSQIDLVDVLSSHLELKRAGGSYKALCPFHDEKTPSFVVQRGDSHYHCFGCGEHGDAIQFLMTYLKMGFVEAVETLAQRFNVTVERTGGEEKGPSKTTIKQALYEAARLYHFLLLHTEEGQEALNYLYGRGLTLEFIRRFQLGWAPSKKGVVAGHLKKFPKEILDAAGLVRRGREFFSERILFPISNPAGAVIGFSGRKIKESTFGGKYINTPETPLFQKSRILFGLNYCRRRIAKEREAIIVEGQLDALRLIAEGLTLTVAGQGTAFGEGQVQELIRLGVQKVYLALDSDQAGKEAAAKIGDLFQREGVEVKVASLPEGSDPDMLLNQEGIEAFMQILEKSENYLPFMVEHLSQTLDINSPAGKNALVKRLSGQIQKWSDPVMVHESLRKLAQLLSVPENVMGVKAPRRHGLFPQQQAGSLSIDPHQVLEADILRWLILMQDPDLRTLAEENLKPEDFRIPAYAKIYQAFLLGEATDLLALGGLIDNEEMLTPILSRKINRDRAKEQFPQALLKLLERNWMERREVISQKMQQAGDEEVLTLAKEFDELKCPTLS